MKYGLNDDAVKRIAAVAHHSKGSNVHGKVSSVYHSLKTPEGVGAVTNAHTTDAMLHRFADKESENTFKHHLAISAAINRGTLDPVPEPENPTPKGKLGKTKG